MRLKFVKILSILLILLGNYSFLSYVYQIKEEKISVVEKSDNNMKADKPIKKENKVKKVNKNINKEYLAIIKIPKINLTRHLYEKGSYMNNVDRNIEILKDSDMPDVDKGNFILAAHNGLSLVSYFKNLDKLDIGDCVNIYYNNKNYQYRISKKYDVLKTGKVEIKKDKSKTSITLITCKEEDKQLVVIGYLI